MENEILDHEPDSAVDQEEQNKDIEMRDSVENPNGEGVDGDESDDSGDSDSDSDSEVDAQQKLQIETLEAELSTNPYNYDGYVQYIKLLRQAGELEKLTQAREAMSSIYPLSPSMWQEWVEDEASVSSGPDAFPIIEKLYERGVSDYQSVSLWCEYLNFLQEHDPSVRECLPDGISKARSLFERAISAGGLHVSEGSKLWEAYRVFEQAILLTIDETETEEKEKQVQRIRSIYHRQLSIPLTNLSSTLIAYKAWEVEQGNVLDTDSSDLEGISPHIASAYKKASEMYDARAHFEELISSKDVSDTELFQHFLNYINFEQSFGDPARIQAIYERAIAKFPISSDLWIDYTRYLDRTLKVGKIVRDVHSRATRSCPWVGELWVHYLLSLERGHASEKEISAVFERALQCSFTNLEEYLDLYLTRIDGLRRRMSVTGAGESLDYSLIRETFQAKSHNQMHALMALLGTLCAVLQYQQACEYLSPHMQNTDGLLRLHSYWSYLELNLGKDLVAARGVWESLLKKSGLMLAAWQGYIDMEINLQHMKEARSIYRRCYTRKFDGTGSEDICHAWLRFEREHGTLEDFDHAVQKVTPRLEELKLLRSQQESKSFAPSSDKKDHLPPKKAREKRKPGLSIDEPSQPKRQKNNRQNANEGDVEAQSMNGLNKEESVKRDAAEAVEVNEEQWKSAKPIKPKVYTDECTVFISNLNLKAHEEDIKKFFSDVGGVVSVRILHDRMTKKSRGLAYVDFVDEEHLAAAIGKNRKMLLGKKVSVARSNPTKGRKESSGPSGTAKQGTSGKTGTTEESGNRDSSEKAATSETSKPPKNSGDKIQLKGKNTFAMPRNVKLTGSKPSKQSTGETGGDEKPKTNEEFSNMFVKK